MNIKLITEKLKSPEYDFLKTTFLNVEVVQLFIGTRSMHLGHLQEKAGYMITFLEKQKIRKIVQLQEIFLIIHS